jgi:hypothetical protein
VSPGETNYEKIRRFSNCEFRRDELQEEPVRILRTEFQDPVAPCAEADEAVYRCIAGLIGIEVFFKKPSFSGKTAEQPSIRLK